MTNHDVFKSAETTANNATTEKTKFGEALPSIPKKDKNFIEGAAEISSGVTSFRRGIKVKGTNGFDNLKRKYRIENLSGLEVSDELIREFSDYFLETFRNPPYSQFAFHIDNPRVSLSPKQLGMPDKKYYSMKETEGFQLPEGYMLWSDREKTYEITKMRLRQGAYISRMVDNNNNTVGLVYGRKATLKQIFESEEMKNPLLFSKFQDSKLYADEETFFKKMNYHCGIERNTEIFYISCMAINPKFQGLKTLHHLMKTFFSSLDKADLDLFSFSELESEGSAHDIDIALSGGVEIFGILENGHPITAGPLRPFAENYYLPFKDLFGLIKKYKIEQKTYRSHVEDNPNVIIGKTENMGKGVFANKNISKGELIANFVGMKYTSNEAIKLPSAMINHAIQVGENEYIYAQNRLAEHINHSCEPNCGIKEYTKVVAMKDIKKDEEINWDYGMSEDSNWTSECKCGTLSCNGEIRPFKNLPDKRKNAYLKNGYLSQWIIDKYKL